MKTRNAARLLAVPAAAGLITLGLAGPASAHVTVTPENTAAGLVHRGDDERPARL